MVGVNSQCLSIAVNRLGKLPLDQPRQSPDCYARYPPGMDRPEGFADRSLPPAAIRRFADIARQGQITRRLWPTTVFSRDKNGVPKSQVILRRRFTQLSHCIVPRKNLRSPKWRNRRRRKRRSLPRRKRPRRHRQGAVLGESRAEFFSSLSSGGSHKVGWWRDDTSCRFSIQYPA